MGRSILDEPNRFTTQPNSLDQIRDVTGELGQPLDAEKDKTQISNGDFAIYLASLIFIVLFYFWLTYALTFDIYTNNVTSSTAINQCNPGQCPTDQKTGEKMCPPPNEKYAYNITTQVCNYPGICRGQLPYAINSDNGVAVNGICQDDPVTGLPLNCRCSDDLTCPDYVLASYNVLTGNPYSSNTNTQFGQNLINQYGGSGSTLSRPNTGFCQIPLSWLLRAQPGCAGVSGSTDLEVAKNCMQLNPCLQGVIAFITNNVSTVTLSSLSQLPVACVRPNYFDSTGMKANGSCDIENGYIPFFDKLSNSVMCKLICPQGYEARFNGGIREGYVAPSGPTNGYSCYPACDQIKYDIATAGFKCS